ncbi:reverse transcriptase domain-containing protein [Tanacetum coccineum]|uniref:Reverse transcriptase domain-containing protein n=1 Tax=Tanacetum coccineum TaxID=301880 RepID=A0ABQ4Y0H3_9ASTR
MMAIFHDMIEETMEVFMDDFSVFRDSFSSCLSHLDKMLKQCEDTNLVLNWEKCHFMVKEGIVLGHKISKSEIEVDKAKVDVIAKIPHPTSIKGVQNFLGHAGFNRRFIQDFSKIARPMTHLLEKETPFIFSKECIEAFNILKRKLTEAPILVALDWDLPFEIMCDASDYAVGVVLGQRKTKLFQPIHYASKTMTDAQAHYTTIEKELLAVMYAFEKFWPYLVVTPSNLRGNSVTFSNLLSDSNEDFTSSNDESPPEEDVLEENFKIYLNPLFEFDEEYISSDVNLLFNEVLEDIQSKDSYVSNLDEPALLVTPLSDANEDECFNPRGDIDEIDDFLDIEVSTDIEDGYHDSEGDIIYLESLLINDTIPNLSPKVFLDHDPRSLKDEPDNDDLKSMVKVFDPVIHSPTYVRFTFEDCHYLSLTFVIKIFLPFLTYLVNSLLFFSGSEDIIFDPDISVFSFYSLEPVVSPQSGTFMIAPDYKDSRARGFVHRSLELLSFACLYMGIRYPRSY